MKNLIYVLIFSCCFLAGCDGDSPKSKANQEESSYVYATVVKKTGTVVAIQKAIDSNQSIMILNENFQKNLVLQLKTDDGKIYCFDILETYNYPSLQAFNVALNEGSRVKIKKDVFYHQALNGIGGILYASQIESPENSDK